MICGMIVYLRYVTISVAFPDLWYAFRHPADVGSVRGRQAGTGTEKWRAVGNRQRVVGFGQAVLHAGGTPKTAWFLAGRQSAIVGTVDLRLDGGRWRCHDSIRGCLE